MSGTLYLQCRRHDEPWHTLNTASFASRDAEHEARRQLIDYRNRWNAPALFMGEQFRIATEQQVRNAALDTRNERLPS